jgi:predicted AAA+ superfamily ATPase
MYKRYIKDKIDDALQDTPVVYVMGPRQSGKTTIVKNIIDEHWEYITFDDSTQLHSAQSDPIGFIRNIPLNKSIVLDEVQRFPELFVSIKQAVDEHRTPGRFLLTGSANALLLPALSDSLAGRMEMILLNTLSEYELLDRTPTFLEQIVQGKAPRTKEIRVRNYLIRRIVTGCFPEPVQREKESRIRSWYNSYLESLIQKDIKDLGHIEHHGEMSKLLEILTLYSGKLINFSELGEKVGLNRITVKKYTALLQQLFLIEFLPAWHTNDYKRLIKTEKIHVVDTGIICAARGLSIEKITENPEIYGALLETFVFNELKKQSSFIEEKLKFSHYRDKDQVEVDIVIENNLDELIGIEIKATPSISQKDFIGLKKLKEITNKKFKIGILLYDGDHTTSFGEGLFAVPIAALWS